MKRSVGILSMQRVINYGSYLQAYALRKMLLECGAGTVDFIDIKPGRNLVGHIASTPVWKRYLKKLYAITKSGSLIPGLKTFFFNCKLKKNIIGSWADIGIGAGVKQASCHDLVVIGSDEVFNCCQDSIWGYSTQLFGDIPVNEAKRIISYAGSFGYTIIDDLKKHGIDKEIGGYLNNMQAISVRDENSQSIIKMLIGKEVPIHLDPVLIYGFEDEIANFKENPFCESYMVVYTYQDRMKDSQEISVIKAYAKKRNLKILSIFCRYDWCDKAIIPEKVLDVLRWFKFADCIVTDTFHGTIFSIITHSNFAVFMRESNKNKLYDLLKTLKLTYQEVDNPNKLENILSNSPSYEESDDILSDFREQSMDYLKNALN